MALLNALSNKEAGENVTDQELIEEFVNHYMMIFPSQSLILDVVRNKFLEEQKCACK